MNIRPAATGLATPMLDALRRNAAAQRAAPSGGAMPASATGLGVGGGVGAGGGVGGIGQAGSFSGALDQALKSVSASQHESTRLAQAFQADPASTSLEQTMVAAQKSQIAFQSALHVRNRLVSAYSDIMNMQV